MGARPSRPPRIPPLPQQPYIEKQEQKKPIIRKSVEFDSNLYPKENKKQTIVCAHKLKGKSSRKRINKSKTQNSDESEWSTRKLWIDDDFKALKRTKKKRTKRRRRPISGKPLKKRKKWRKKRRIQRTRMKLAQFMMKVPSKLVFTRRNTGPFQEWNIPEI